MSATSYEATQLAAMRQLAAELKLALPQEAQLDEAKAHALLGGPIGKVLAIIAALQTGDTKAAWRAFKDLGDLLLGEAATPGGGGLQFALGGGKFDFKAILGILAKLLPLLAGAA